MLKTHRHAAHAAFTCRVWFVAAIMVLGLSSGAPAACEPAPPVVSSTLLTGSIRDDSGLAVPGADVRALDRAGQIVARDIAGSDGTFALETPTAADAVTIECDFCRPLRLTVTAPGDPLVAIVHRYTGVLSGAPSPADIRALPYRRAADVAALRPWTVVDNGRISERGLAPYGANRVDGIPLYSAADGDDYTRLIPAGALASLAPTSPLSAPIYGGYASAGGMDFRLTDPDVTDARVDLGEAFGAVVRAVTPNVLALYAASNDAGLRRAAAATNIAVPFAGGRLGLEAVDLADATSHAAGTGLTYTTDSRRYSTSAAIRASAGDDTSLVTVDAHLRNRGPLGLEMGVRALRATATAGGAQSDVALYADAAAQSGTVAFAADVAADRGSDANASSALRAAGLVGSLSSDVRLDARWSAHVGLVSNLRIPTFAELSAAAPATIAGDRSFLLEQSVTYTDRRRMRLALVAFTQRTTGAFVGRLNGVGIDGGWQFTPHLAVRAWILGSNPSSAPATATAPYADANAATASRLNRGALWLTYDGAIRADAVVRGRALEGDVRIPLDALDAVAIGTSIDNGKRITTVGLTRR